MIEQPNRRGARPDADGAGGDLPKDTARNPVTHRFGRAGPAVSLIRIGRGPREAWEGPKNPRRTRASRCSQVGQPPALIVASHSETKTATSAGVTTASRL